jgi:putative ABC transport system permease protein
LPISKFLLLIFRNLHRNRLRTAITCLAVMVLVLVVTMIWTVIYFIDNLTKEKKGNLRAIVTDRYDMQGQLPLSYADPLSRGAARNSGDKVPVDSMSWQIYLGSLDPKKQTRDTMVVLIAMETRQLPTKIGKKVIHKGMIDDLDPIDQEIVDKLAETTNGCLLGRKRLKLLNKKVGERINVTGSQPSRINLEFEIVGMLPAGRWDENGVMNVQYLNAAIDKYVRANPASKVALDRRIEMFWIEVGSRPDFPQVLEQINTSPLFKEPPVKCESYASLVANFLDSYSGFIWFIQWVLVPGSIFSMMLLIANAISLSVRERIKELAILKVIGFRPGHLLLLVLGEAVFLGTGSGLIAGGLIYWIANALFSGISVGSSEPLPVPWQAILWGGGVGGTTSLIGSLVPAWTAAAVRVANVFARVG